MSCDGWKTLKVKELGAVVTGKTPSSKNPEHFGSHMPFVTPTDFKNYHKMVTNAERYLSWSGKQVLENKVLPASSVIVTCIGSDMGRVALTHVDCVTNQQINAVVPLNDKADSNFIYYQFTNMYDYLTQLARGGTTMPIINKKTFEDISIEIPPLPEQQAIAATLSCLDDKIELNNRINKVLEDMAQALFKSWFVDFEPFQDGGFVDSELGPIPKGWRVGSLDEFFPVVTGKKNANVASNQGEYPFFSCAQSIAWTDCYSFEGSAILVAGNGDFNVKTYQGRFEAYQRTYVLMPNDPELTGLLYHAVKHGLTRITSGHRGSVINFITKGMIANHQIAVPPDASKTLAARTLMGLVGFQRELEYENRKLASIRDTLLPKLMSGEIRVPLNDAETEAASS